MNSRKIALISYIYPGSEKFFDNFIECLNNQSNKDFSVIFFSDQFYVTKDTFNDLKVKYQLITLEAKSIPAIRYKSFSYLLKSEFDYLIFQDIDDTSSFDRIDIISEKLTQFDLVCNDITITNHNDEVIAESVWKKRLGEKFCFTQDFIKHFNIVGLGNTGIRKELLKKQTLYSDTVLATDWFIFYQLLKNSNALFTSKTQTFYKQHHNNTAGLNNKIDENSLRRCLTVKQKQYDALGISELRKKEIEALKSLLLQNIQTIQLDSYPFWFEENILYENYTNR